MKYGVFMRSRSHTGQYGWICKPDYMPDDIYKTCQSIIALREKHSFDAFTEEDWYGNFFFVKADGCVLLARIATTVYKDSFDRNIYSFEGVCAKAENEKRFFYDIPNLINAMLPPARSFRAAYETEGEIPKFFESDSAINPLKSAKPPKEVHPAVKNNPAFANLMKFVAYSEKADGFIFGKNARAFAGYVNKSALEIKRVFDFTEPDPARVSEKAFLDNYKPIECEYVKPVLIGKESVAVYLVVQEAPNNKYKYCWQVKSFDGDKFSPPKFTTRFYDVDDKLSLATLELQKESLKRFLEEQNWKKQQFGLRFEKEIFAAGDGGGKR